MNFKEIMKKIKEKTDKYIEEAPQRRERDLEKLRYEAEKERLKAQIRKEKEKNQPKENKNQQEYNIFGGK